MAERPRWTSDSDGERWGAGSVGEDSRQDDGVADRGLGHDAGLPFELLDAGPLGRAAVHGQQHARRTSIRLLARVRHRPGRFHVRPQHEPAMRFSERRDGGRELSREDERAADSANRVASKTEAGGRNGHIQLYDGSTGAAVTRAPGQHARPSRPLPPTGYLSVCP